MIILRLFYGFVFGITIPIGLLMVTEISLPEIRGRMSIYLQFMHFFGKLYGMFWAFEYIENLSEGDWRSLAITNTIPTFFMVIFSLCFLKESPRFLIVNNRIDEGVLILNEMGASNHKEKFIPLTNGEIQGLILWRNSSF